MNTQNFLKQFVTQFGENFGPGFESLSKDIQQQLKTALQTTLDKMDLVTRDEFDAQCAVLQRSREKIEQLEKQLDSLLKKTGA